LSLLPDRADGEASLVRVEGKQGRATLPAGSYMVLDWQIEALDKNGRKWKLTGDWLPQRLEIRAGKESLLRLATPLRAHLMVYPEAEPASFRVRYTGPAGERVNTITMDELPPPLPILRVSDAQGKIVQSVTFQPGCGCLLPWKAPAGMRGRYKAIVDVKMGPFPVEVGPGTVFDLADSVLQLPEPSPGNPAPDAVLTALDGSTVQFSFLRDRPIVLGFLCRCDACRALATALSKQADLKRRAHVLAVLTEPEIGSVEADDFRTTTGFPGIVFQDPERNAIRRYRAIDHPRVFVIGTDGRIRLSIGGQDLPAGQVAAEIGKALGM
jgi:peroxiredoxin